MPSDYQAVARCRKLRLSKQILGARDQQSKLAKCTFFFSVLASAEPSTSNNSPVSGMGVRTAW